MSKKYDDLFSIENPRAFAIEVMARHNFKSSEELALFFKSMPYCIAPWLHSHLNPAGERKLCCVALPSGIDGNTAFSDYWNSEYMQGVREKMLAHQPPAECAHCVHFKGVGAQRSIYLHLLLGLPDLPKLKWTTLTSQKPVSLDYRINRHCNFSCRMCASTASSRIEHLEEKAKIEFTENRITAEQFAHFKNEMFDLIKSGELLDLNFADGEPFLSPLHWEILDYLVKNQLSKKVILRYSSNISTLNYKGIYIPQYFKDHFNKVFISMSIDGVKETAEFVRDGLRWESFYQNYQTLKNELGPKVVRFNITVSIPVLLDIVAMADFLDREDIVYSIDSAYPMGHELILSPLSLDKKTLSDIIYARIPKIKNAQMKQFLNSLLDHYQEESFKLLKKNFNAIRTYYIKLDTAANRTSTMKYLASQEELRAWWDSICPPSLDWAPAKRNRHRFQWVPQEVGRFIYKSHFSLKQLEIELLYGRHVKIWSRNSLNLNFFQFASSDIDVSAVLDHDHFIVNEAQSIKTKLMSSPLIKEVNLYYPYSLKKLSALINRIEAKRDPILVAHLDFSLRPQSLNIETEVFCWRMLLANKHLYETNASEREEKKWHSYFKLADLDVINQNHSSPLNYTQIAKKILDHFHGHEQWLEDIERIAFYLTQKIDIQTLYHDLDFKAEMLALFPQIFCSVDMSVSKIPESLADHFLAQLSWELASTMAQIAGDGAEKATLDHLEKIMTLLKRSHLNAADKLIGEYLSFDRFLRSGGALHG